MELSVFIAFFIATSIMIALPGPSVLLTVAHSISFGWQRALITVAGATIGIAVQILIAAIGLSSLLNTIAEAFDWLRWAGAIYLVYLGIKQWLSAGNAIEFDGISISRANILSQGIVITIFNPKSLIFIAAFLPQFIDTTRPLGIQFTVIIPTFLLITFFVTSIWAVAAGNISSFFKGKQSFKTVFQASGGLMVVAGLGLALARRGN